MTRYASIDIETTGLDPLTCQVIEIAAVVETDWATPLDRLPTFHRLVEHDEYRGSAYAIDMNARVFRELAKSAEMRVTPTTCPDLLAADLSAFLTDHLGRGPWTAAGKNFATFDLRFLERLPRWAEHVRLRHRVIDPAALWLDPVKDDRLPDTPTCLDRAGAANSDAHHPVADARAVIELVRRAFARRTVRVAG